MNISRRDYFAGQALNGLLANKIDNYPPELMAEWILKYADSLIKKLDETSPETCWCNKCRLGEK